MNRKNELNPLGKKVITGIEELITYYESKESIIVTCPLCKANRKKSEYFVNCELCPWIIFEDIRCEYWVLHEFGDFNSITRLQRNKPIWFTSIRILMLRRWWVTILYGKCPRIYLKAKSVNE